MVRTLVLEKFLLDLESKKLYDTLLAGKWTEGVRSRNGPTRLARVVDMKSDEGELLLGVVADALSMMRCVNEKIPDYCVYGIYLNYYKDGNMYTPNHTHLKTHQLVISLGASRTFNIGKKSMTLKGGDAVLFGSAVHGVPKDPSVVDGRISIATFMSPIVEK